MSDVGANVDVAINVHGKPLQTAVTLLSLLEHSGQWIDRIWFIEERKQPFGAAFEAIKKHLVGRLVHFRPAFWLGVRTNEIKWVYRWGPFRRSVRYQVAWERSRNPFLFLTHNDVLYSGDIIGAMLERSAGHIAVGPVGQCWNCSAHRAGRYDPDRFMDFQPDYEEWLRLSTEFPGARADQYDWVIDPRRPWPLPECRVNEWSMLVDLRRARPATMPQGPAVPLGTIFGLDIGTQWFHDVITAGHTVRHLDIAPYARHAWASSTGGGHAALSDEQEYQRSERLAEEHLRARYPEFIR